MGFIFKPWNKLSLFTRIMIGFALGVAAGLIFGRQAAVLKPLGTILTNLLTMVVAPLVLCLLVCAAADVGDGKKLGRMGVKTVVVFLVSTALAIVIGLIFANLMQVGTSVSIELAKESAKTAAKQVSMLDTLINVIPKNPFEALSKQNLLQIIFFALLLGFALMKIGPKGQALLDMFRSGQEAMKKITTIVLEFTPYGVFGLMADIVGKYGLDVMLPFVKTIAACYVMFTLFVQGGLMCGIYAGISPKKFFSTMKEAMLFVFATCSSVATIPLNLKCTKKLGVSDKIADFVLFKTCKLFLLHK